MTRYRLGDVSPNRFRNIDRYPIDRTKVEALKGSIERTSFWDNIVARAVDGKAEIAYGHHRLVALNELFGPDHEVALITRPLTDAEMLHIMADENMQEWTASAPVIVETVRAVRDFLDSAAPGKREGSNGEKPGSAKAITAFLGWPPGRVEDALGILAAEDAGLLKPEDTAGLGIEQAAVMRRQVSKIASPAVRRQAVKAVKEDLAIGKRGHGSRGIPEVVRKVRVETGDLHPVPVVPAAVAKALYSDIEGYWRTTVLVNNQRLTRKDLLRLIAANRNAEELTRSVAPWADQLAHALDEMATEAKSLADLLRAEQALVEAGA